MIYPIPTTFCELGPRAMFLIVKRTIGVWAFAVCKIAPLLPAELFIGEMLIFRGA